MESSSITSVHSMNPMGIGTGLFKQEGTPATNREIARAIRLISKEFVNKSKLTHRF